MKTRYEEKGAFVFFGRSESEMMAELAYLEKHNRNRLRQKCLKQRIAREAKRRWELFNNRRRDKEREKNRAIVRKKAEEAWEASKPPD